MDFSGRRILDDLNLVVASSQSVAIMGPSGAGKSTLLALIHGQITPSGGRVVNKNPPDGTQWIVQSAPHLTHRTALDNVALGPLGRGFTRDSSERRALKAMEELNIGSLGDVAVRRLSGGERQRLAIARALAAGPKLLLVDEPTAALDYASRDLVIDAMRRTIDSAVTVVLVTHDREVAGVCERVFELSGGQLKAWS
ncbi:ATP-binding cassette domain-containing protein [Microbacterium testaceum]|uniref:ATP-binding cassette domain-containing protein n=1 Tax=Microbacterium testaceum TaxID=2033 RepID=UPI00341ECFE3